MAWYLSYLSRTYTMIKECCMSRVLIVDDEKNVLKTLSIGLRRYKYLVEQAQNGPDALTILDRESCDFVVSDIRMSPMDGYTLASEIQQK